MNNTNGMIQTKLQKVSALVLVFALAFLTIATGRTKRALQAQSFDVIIKGGTVYDGTGRAPVQADVGIKGERIAAIGNLGSATAPTIVDAKGLAVAPGFINMTNWSGVSNSAGTPR